MTIATLSKLPATHRRWRDLRKRSLLLGLVLAPVLPVLAGGLLMQMLDAYMLFGPVLKFCGWVVLAADGWSLVVGSACLFLIARWRGTIRRGDCLLLGAGLAFTLPIAAQIAAGAIDWASGLTDGPAPIMPEPFILLLGMLLIPFGTFGGWMFWRVGVRPARTVPVDKDVAAVFE